MSISEAAANKAHAREHAAAAKHEASRLKAEEAAARLQAQGLDACIILCVVCSELFALAREQRHGDDPDRWRCDECVSTGLQLRWPLTGVDSSAFSAMPNVQRMHDMAVAFLESARVLCEALGGSTTISWPRASVVLSTSSHAVELFLKACILTVSPNDNVGHHNSARLVQRFDELFPTLDPPDPVWDPQMGDIPTDQLFRYGADRTGVSLEGGDTLMFSPPIWIKWIEDHELLFRQIWSAIS
ncbi:MAG: hypothetical protein ACREBE_29320 [bacterium]